MSRTVEYLIRSMPGIQEYGNRLATAGIDNPYDEAIRVKTGITPEDMSTKVSRRFSDKIQKAVKIGEEPTAIKTIQMAIGSARDGDRKKIGMFLDGGVKELHEVFNVNDKNNALKQAKNH